MEPPNLFNNTEDKGACSLTQNTKKAIIYADGGSRGNPGIAGAGCALFDTQGKEIACDRIPCGHQTNNFAEYTGMIRGMELALENNVTDLLVRLDSKLAIEQMSGHWKVKNANIKPLFEKAYNLKEKFNTITFEHVPREKNKRADQLANEAMDIGY